MRRLIIAFIFIWGALYVANTLLSVAVIGRLTFGSRLAYGQVPQTGAGLAKPASGGGGFSGPGDVVSSPLIFFATHSCVTSAYVGNVMSVWDAATGNTTHTQVTCTAGGVVHETINTLATTCASACEIETITDQVGTGCGGSTCTVTEPHTQRPTLTLSALNTSACAALGGATAFDLEGSNNITLAQPFTVVQVAERQSAGGTSLPTPFLRDNANQYGNIRAGWNLNPNQAGAFNGGSFTGATASDDAFHSLSYVFSDATQSVIYVDGTGTNISLGSTNGFPGTSSPAWGVAASSAMSGLGCEIAVWARDIGSTAAASLSTNARSRYGSF